jgi:DNA repair exonuclease SbcCD ATPase subunit
MRNNNQSRGTTTEILLMEIADGLSSLIKQPDLSNKIKEAYALNEAEQKAFEEAKATLSQAESLRAEITQKATKYQDIETKIKENTLLLEDIKKSRSELMAINKINESTKNDLEAEKKALDEVSTALDKRQQKLDEFATALSAQATEIEAKKEEIRLGIEKSRTILGGLAING